MRAEDITVEIVTGDDGRPFARVNLAFDNQDVTFAVHDSATYRNTVTVEIDGEFTDGRSLRVNVNDDLVFDSVP